MSLFWPAAILMLVLAHIVRAIRQAMLFPATARPRTFHLTVGLSIAYVVDTVIPFRIGEAARALYVAARANQGFGRVGATVIAERFSDLLVVTAGFALLSLFVPGWALPWPRLGLMAVAVLAVIVAATLLRRSRQVRAALWFVASVFNDTIRTALVDMAWRTARLIGSTALLRPRYVLFTMLMWSAYLLSYLMLSQAAGLDPVEVTTTLLGDPLSPLLGASRLDQVLVLFTTLAALAILVCGLAADGSGIQRSLRHAVRFGLPAADAAEMMPEPAFARSEDYGAILRAHFTETGSVYAGFGLHGLDGAVVQRFLPGGSDAITAVVEAQGMLSIRKFALGDAAEKLADQARWLARHRDDLPLADIVSEHHGGAHFRYDMPYLSSARDLYEMVHVMPPSASRALLGEVVAGVGAWHDRARGGAAGDDAVAAYVERKVIANARAVLDFVRLELPEDYRINGDVYHLGEWDCLLDPAWIEGQLRDRRVGALHGDLTIENIIVCPERAPGWYLIDPNPGNLFDTPFIDWAKLMQSLNLGYESQNRGPPARLGDGSIDVMFGRSQAYAELHDAFRDMLIERLGEDGLREVSFHEIVNYLRLIPYKMRHHPAKAMSFFAAASVLLRRYREAKHG